MISVKVDNRDVLAAMLRAPNTIKKQVSQKLKQASIDVSDEARRIAPVSHSTLGKSIRGHRISQLEYHVVPGVNYARAVEEGTKPGYWPNLGSLYEYLKTKQVRTEKFRWKRKGSLGRVTQEAELVGRAIGLMRYIHAHGTKPHPFMAPTAKKMEDRVIQLVREGVADGLRAAGLA